MNPISGAEQFRQLSAQNQARYIAINRQLARFASDHAVPIIFAPPLSIGGKINGGASGCVVRLGADRVALEEKLAAEGVSNRPNLEAERSDLETRARHLVDAIAQHGFSQFLSAQLTEAESRLAEIERLLKAKPAAKLPTFTEEQIANFLRKECEGFCELLKSDPEIARGEIQKRIKKLILTPKETPAGAVLEVSGDIELLRAGDVLDESPLEGIAQQYTVPRMALANIMLDPSLPAEA